MWNELTSPLSVDLILWVKHTNPTVNLSNFLLTFLQIKLFGKQTDTFT